MAMQQRDVVESFLRHGGTKKCFESSRGTKSFVLLYIACDKKMGGSEARKPKSLKS